MIYYVLFISLGFLAACEVISNQRKGILKYISIFIVLFILIIFAGFRKEIGIDIGSYEIDYQKIRSGRISIFNILLEPGYSVLNYLAPSFRVVLVLMAVMSIGLRYKAIQRNKLAFVLLVLFFYYGTDFIFYDMGIMRQGLSISICLYALPMIKTKDKKFFILIAVAALFHISSLLFSLMWFVSDKEYPRRFYYTWIAIVTLLIVGGMTYTKVLSSIVNSLNIPFLEHKFNKFVTYDEVNITISYIRRVLFVILFVELFKRGPIKIFNMKFPKRITTDMTWLHINGFFMSCILFGLFSLLFSSVAGRMTAMFYAINSFIYCDIFSDKHQHLLNAMWFVVFSILLFETFNGSIHNQNGNYLPYAFGV